MNSQQRRRQRRAARPWAQLMRDVVRDSKTPAGRLMAVRDVYDYCKAWGGPWRDKSIAKAWLEAVSG